MRSKVAETLDAEQRAANLAIPVDERMELMLAMGEQQLRDYMSAHSVSRDEAMRRLEHARQSGRRPSAVMERIIDESRPPDPRDSR